MWAIIVNFLDGFLLKNIFYKRNGEWVTVGWDKEN